MGRIIAHNLKENRIKVLLVKPILYGHDRGVIVVAQAFKKASTKVIYTCLYSSIHRIVKQAIPTEKADSLPLRSSQTLMDEIGLRDLTAISLKAYIF